MITVERLVDWGYPVELAELIVESQESPVQDEYDERDDEERYHYDSL